MLTDEEKAEMLADAADAWRRDSFRQAEAPKGIPEPSLQNSLAFVMQLRKVFPDACPRPERKSPLNYKL